VRQYASVCYGEGTYSLLQAVMLGRLNETVGLNEATFLFLFYGISHIDKHPHVTQRVIVYKYYYFVRKYYELSSLGRHYCGLTLYK
jgi:hypothetical protein